MKAGAAEIVIRRMHLEDVRAVITLDRASFPLPWSERAYRLELTENTAAHLFVAETAGERPRVIGYGGFWFLVEEAHISTLAVDPCYRRKGIGGRLLRHLLREARKLGAETVTLEVRASNREAQALYRKHGFEVRAIKPRYYRDNDEDALLMELNLAAWGGAAQEDGNGRC